MKADWPSSSAGPGQQAGQGRESPGVPTFHLRRQVCPSLHSYSDGTPHDEVEGNAQQIQPPNHLRGKVNGQVRGEPQPPRGPDGRSMQGEGWTLTGLPSRYTRKSVSLIPEKRRPCGAEDTLLIHGPMHPSHMCSGGRKTSSPSPEPGQEAQKLPILHELSGKSGQNQDKKQSPVASHLMPAKALPSYPSSPHQTKSQ